MAINKKLIYYNRTLSEFLSDANGLNGQSTKDANNNVGNIPFASIVFTSDGYIWTHGKIFNGNNTLPPVTSVNGQTGDVTLTLDNIADGSSRKLANYLPLTGGVISSDAGLNALFVVNSTNGVGPCITQRYSGTVKSHWGYYPSGQYTYLSNEVSKAEIRITDGGVLQFTPDYSSVAALTIWHSGNDGSGSNLDADLLDGQHGSYYATASSLSNYVTLTGAQTISGNKIFSSSVSIDDLTAGNLVVTGGASFALTINGNVASATQLQTSRSIWGQSFNGTRDVDGTIHIHTPNATNFDEGIRIHTSNLGYAGLVFCGTDNIGDTGTSSNTWSIYTNSGNFYINKNASILHSGYELCNVGGNWGIGTISPSYKLDVNGNARIGSIIADNTPFTDSLNIIANQTNESTVTTFNEAASSWGITFIRDWNTQGYNVEQAGIYAVGCSDWRAGLAFRVKANTGGTGYSHDTTAMYITPVGNVGIGTTSPLDKLDVRGTATISDITTMAGAIKVIPSVWSELFTYYGLASDYTSRYDTEEFLKAWVKYAYDKGAGYTVMSYISPNSRGFIEADVYASGINSTTGFPEHITGRYYPHGGSEIIFGTSYGTWYYRTGIDSGNISSQSVYYAGNADTATYASNVGAAGTAGTNYVTAANVISMYNWYNGITATDEASNTAIDKWNEIVSFLTGITDTSTLSGILAGYAAVGHDHDGRYLRNYHKNTDITSTEVVADSDYIHNVGETGGSSTTMTKPTGMDNAWGILHMHLHTGNYAMQLGFGGTTGHMYFRNAYNSSTFGSWKTLIDSDNIGSQSVASATSAGAVAWTGVTSQMHEGNEFNIADYEYPYDSFWFNYLPRSYRSSNPTELTTYHLGNLRGGYATLKTSGFIHNSYNSYSYLLTSDGSVRHENTWQRAVYTTLRDFANGTLIYTDIDYSNTSGDPFYLEIKGNTYGHRNSCFTQAQGYIWDNTIINYGVSHIGVSPIDGLIAMNIDGALCFWFPRQSYWEGYSIVVNSAYDYRTNRVTNVTDSADPGGTKRVELNTNTVSSIMSSGGTMTGSLLWRNARTGIFNLGTSATPSSFTVDTNGGNLNIGIISWDGSSDEGGILVGSDCCTIYNSSDSGYVLKVIDKDISNNLANTYLNSNVLFSVRSDGCSTFTANNSWLTPAVLQIGRPDGSAYTDRACIGVTDGNLHIDSYPNHDIYLNYYSGNATVHIGSYTAIHSGNEFLALTTQQSVTSLIFGNGYDPASISSGSFISGDGTNYTYGASTDVIQIKLNCVSIGDIWRHGVTPDYKLRVVGIIGVTNNGNTVEIGSQNSSWCHFENTADIPFYFNKSVHVDGGICVYGTSYNINSGTSVLNDLRVSGADLYIGSTSGSQCHLVYDDTNKCLKFIFD